MAAPATAIPISVITPELRAERAARHDRILADPSVPAGQKVVYTLFLRRCYTRDTVEGYIAGFARQVGMRPSTFRRHAAGLRKRECLFWRRTGRENVWSLSPIGSTRECSPVSTQSAQGRALAYKECARGVLREISLEKKSERAGVTAEVGLQPSDHSPARPSDSPKIIKPENTTQTAAADPSSVECPVNKILDIKPLDFKKAYSAANPQADRLTRVSIHAPSDGSTLPLVMAKSRRLSPTGNFAVSADFRVAKEPEPKTAEDKITAKMQGNEADQAPAAASFPCDSSKILGSDNSQSHESLGHRENQRQGGDFHAGHAELREFLETQPVGYALDEPMFRQIAALIATASLLAQFKAVVETAQRGKKWAFYRELARQVAARGDVEAARDARIAALMEQQSRPPARLSRGTGEVSYEGHVAACKERGRQPLTFDQWLGTLRFDQWQAVTEGRANE